MKVDDQAVAPSQGVGFDGNEGSPVRCQSGLTRQPETPVLSQAMLNIDEKVRSNSFPWRGQFSPQLVEAHLEAYSKRGDVVLDPFVGSGTVLIECARRGNAAFGTEINPAAAIMARTYEFATLPQERRAHIVRRVDRCISELDRLQDLPLFASGGAEADLRGPFLGRVTAQEPGTPERNILETLVVMLDFHAGEVLPTRLHSTWANLRRLVVEFPPTSMPITVTLADARDLPLDDGTVDLVLTSPPYINVFNYHQQYRASVEALQWDVLPLARSEIGSNRKHRQNRFLTVIQYCLDMAQVLVELTRVCKPEARVILVVGRESNVRKTAFYNGRIIRRLAHDCLGLQVVLEQERVFQNRFGQDIYEDILHISAHLTEQDDSMQKVRNLAAQILEEAAERAPAESLGDLQDARSRIADIAPSPIAALRAQPLQLVKGFPRRWNGARA